PGRRPGRIVDGGRPRARGELVELLEVVRGHEVGILDAGEGQGAHAEIELGLGAMDEFGPGPERRLHQHPGAWWTPAVASAARCSSSASSRVLRAAVAAAAWASGVVASRKSRPRPSSW